MSLTFTSSHKRHRTEELPMGFVLVFFGLAFGFYAADEQSIYFLVIGVTAVVVGGALEIADAIMTHKEKMARDAAKLIDGQKS